MDIHQELQKREQQFQDYWIKYLPEKQPQILYQAARHLPLGGGKRLRPFLAMIACESVGGDGIKTLPFGSALELLHNFTLVHDDIMDNSDLRRSVPTVHIQFSEAAAILAGDLLFTKSFEAMHDLQIECSVFRELNHKLIQCVLRICEGQQLDVDFEQQKIITEQQYLDMIMRKTAVLFELSALGGAIIGGADQQQIHTLTEYGMNIGYAFQIWDDFLDISSNTETLGKDIGNDIRNGKKTLIAVHALHHAQGEHKKILDVNFGNAHATEKDIQQVFTVLEQIGSIEYARSKALEYNIKAKQLLSMLPQSEAKRLLFDLADYSIQREK
ncbi:MAG: polyprenyl synthetase family protein [Thermoplasmatota archaeon]